jgi:hypothetical protein
MADIIKEIEEIRKSVPKLAQKSDEDLFSLLCYKFFYNDARLDYKDYSDCFVDGKLDGGIDLITIQEDESQDKLVFVQSKFISSLSNKQDIIDVFTKMDQTIKNFQDYRTSQYNARLKRIFKEKLAQVEDKSPIYELALFISVDPTSEKKDEISLQLESIDELKQYQLSVVYRSQIEEAIQNATDPRTFVREGKIRIKKECGVIKYGDNGLLVNVWANSIKDLYDRFKDCGLFEQNFRYFVRNKRIDDNIRESLEKKRQIFWYMNNGIIIGCKDFSIDGDNVRLFAFSIINGCQTATLIGDYKGPHQQDDFVLPCKIVKPLEEERTESFISEIAEASNSQKPISDRDLKSNRQEQRNLQKQLKQHSPEIYLEIKRGSQLVSSGKKKQLQRWQLVRNDYYGQIMLSFHFQCPGTARNSKKEIFAVEKTYNKIFRRPVDKQNIVDLLKLNSLFTDYLNSQDLQGHEENVAMNGRFVLLAVIGFMIKEKRKLIDLKKFGNEEAWEKEISRDNISGGLFKEPLPDDYNVFLNGLFFDIICEISSLYQMREQEEKTISNFFKTDTKYRNVILKHIINRYYSNPMKAKERDNYLQIFT